MANWPNSSNASDGESKPRALPNGLATNLLANFPALPGVEIIKTYKTDDKCIGNEDQLNQVWINLLNNCLQSMDYKGKIEIRIEKIDSWIVTSFIDSGAGIPIEIQDRIFDPFFTTKKHGEGIGLGLDICKTIITSMGGKIEFESVPGNTKFSVWLKSADAIEGDLHGN